MVSYFILNYKIFKFIKSDATIWEQEPIKKLVSTNQLAAYKHNGFGCQWIILKNTEI